MDMIEQYKNFKVGNAVCSIPYFNNKTTARRGGLPAEVGKGSPQDIREEVEQIALQNKVDINALTPKSLKKFLVDNNIGIDCSGFAYHVLNDESIKRGKGEIDKNIHFTRTTNIFSKLFAKLRPEKNIDVVTFANNKNSKFIPVKDVKVGDIITMINALDNAERNHILIIDNVEYKDSLPVSIHYVHAIAWPTYGEYGHGIHEGVIEITDLSKGIVEQKWTESEKINEENYTHTQAKKSVTELRRLNWFD